MNCICAPSEWSWQRQGVSPRWRPLGAYGRVPLSKRDPPTATLNSYNIRFFKAALIPTFGRGGAAFQGVGFRSGVTAVHGAVFRFGSGVSGLHEVVKESHVNVVTNLIVVDVLLAIRWKVITTGSPFSIL